MNPQDQALIEAVATGKLGVPPSAPQGAPQPQPQQQATEGGDKPTAGEIATDKGAPSDPHDMPSYKIDFGNGDVRELTPNQIKSTFERYAKLNHDHQSNVAPMRPVLDFVSKIINGAKERGIEANPEDVAKFLEAATKSFTANPTMGGDQKSNQHIQPGAQHPPISQDGNGDALEEWALRNGVDLPPGYREAGSKIGQLEQAVTQMAGLLQQLVGQQASAGNIQSQVDEHKVAASDAAGQAMKQKIVNNLMAAQQKLGLPDEAEQDFFNFAFDRGYTIEDFIDPSLALNVAQDFKNNMDSPEIERLRSMAQRRQAFTGSPSGAPAAGAPMSTDADPSVSAFNGLVDYAMQRR